MLDRLLVRDVQSSLVMEFASENIAVVASSLYSRLGRFSSNELGGMEGMSIAYELAAILSLVWVAWRLLDAPFWSSLVRPWRRYWYRVAKPHGDSLQAALDAHLAIEAPAGAIAAALIDPKTTRCAFAGRINGRKSLAPDADTLFEIGSITKSFTAALLLALEPPGELSLGMPIDALLGEAGRLGAQMPRAITLQDLVTHRSGLPRLPWGLPMLSGLLLRPRQPYAFMSANVLTRWLQRRRVEGVGERYAYSNLGYAVLGKALARKAGLDYHGALRRHILDPLGLHETGFGDDTARSGRMAQPRTLLGLRTRPWRMRALAAAGGLHSSLADMARWLEANLSLHPPLDARMHQTLATVGSHGAGIAMGWQVSGVGSGVQVLWHNGRTGGSCSFMAFIPARGIGVVVMCTQAASVDELGARLIQGLVASAEQPGTAG